jgi:hypothetical protein
MALAILGIIAMFLVPLGIALALSHASAERRRGTLARIAEGLVEGACQPATATGVCRDLEVSYTFVTRGSGSTSETWTEIAAAIPAKYPLSIHVRRHGRSDWARIERGEMVDVIVGAPEFDAAFLVEVAPADVARLLLDQDARSLLEQYDPVELTTVTVDNHRVLRFSFRTWCEDSELAIVLIDQVARIASRVRDAYRLAEQSTATDDATGGPYRPELDETATRAAAAQRTVEVHHLEALRANRSTNAGWLVPIVGFLVILTLTVLVAMAGH